MGAPGDSIHILHVDDEPDFAEMAADFLEGEDDRFTVMTMTSADDGLDRVADNEIDCVVSDHDMPGTDGIEFLEAVREKFPDLPFILFTGKGSEAVASDAISAGVTDYLQKEGGTEQYEILANRIRNAVERARAQHDRQRHLDAIETAQEGISILSEDGEFIYVNESYADLYGYDPEEMIGEHWELIYRDEDVSRISDEILPMVETNGYWHGKTTGLRADGSTFVEDHRLATTEHGELVCTVQDITDREERERELERRTEELEAVTTRLEEQYRTLFEEAPVMIVLTRAEEGRPIIEDCNTQFCDTLGYEKETVVGSELATYYSSASRERLLDEGGYERSLEGDFTRELRELLTTDGEVVETLLRAVPRRDTDGEVVGTMAMFIDITEQETVKRANERLEEFTSIVSHDLRNPLNVAQGNVELAREECDSEHLDSVARAHERMAVLIDDLLTLARHGTEAIDEEPVRLADCVDACWKIVETADATLVVETEQTIRADRSQLQQLFENLYRNAVEHGGDHVTITIGELADGFYVADDGPGIPPDEREAVFDAGYSTSEDGTGFGLSIVQEVVEAHGWEIGVTDSETGGARFEITGVETVAE